MAPQILRYMEINTIWGFTPSQETTMPPEFHFK